MDEDREEGERQGGERKALPNTDQSTVVTD